MPSSRLRTVRKSTQVTLLPVFHVKAPRRVISQVVCHGLLNCSKHVVRKDHAIIAESEGRVEFGKDYKNKRRVIVQPVEDGDEATEYLVPKGRHLSVQEGDYVQIGDALMDGNPVPHDILARIGC